MAHRFSHLAFTSSALLLAFTSCADDDDNLGSTAGGPSAGAVAAAGEAASGSPASGEAGARPSGGQGGQPAPFPTAGASGQEASAAAASDGGMGGAAGGAPAATFVLGADGTLEGVDDTETSRALYFHGGDLPASTGAPAVSRCLAACAETWPPFHRPDVIVGDRLSSDDFADVVREDGQAQLSFHGWPVYAYAGDAQPGARSGDGVEQLWHRVSVPFPTLIVMRQLEPQDSGLYLADERGHTLYLLLGDEPGSATRDPVSTCTTNGCRKTWPMFAPPRVGPVSSLSKSLAIFIRPGDGQVQLAYDGLPLYFFVDDLAPGDLNGVTRPSWLLATP